ncbi:unnamed protein product, partial [Ectocarpus sp. 4 AP-2014]
STEPSPQGTNIAGVDACCRQKEGRTTARFDDKPHWCSSVRVDEPRAEQSSLSHPYRKDTFRVRGARKQITEKHTNAPVRRQTQNAPTLRNLLILRSPSLLDNRECVGVVWQGSKFLFVFKSDAQCVAW